MTKITGTKERGVKPLLFIILALVMIICETPYLSRNMSIIVVEILMVGFVLYYFAMRKNLTMDLWKTTIAVSIYIFIELLYKFAGKSSAGVGFYFATIKFLFIFFAITCIANDMTLKQKKYLCVLSIVAMVVNMISNMSIYSGMDASSYVVYYLYGGQGTNAADTAFSTAVMLMMGVLFLMFLHRKEKWLRILSLVLVLFCGYFLIFIAQRGTTFFLSIMMLFLLMVFQANTKKLVFLLLVLALFVFWLAMGGIIPVLTWLSDFLLGQRVNLKIEYVIRFFQIGSIYEVGGSLTDRFELTMRSIRTFFGSVSSFLIGLGDHRVDNSVIGNHSQYIDTFARYGVIGGAVLIYLVRRMLESVKRVSNTLKRTPLRRQVLLLFAFFCMRSFLGNTFIGSIGTQMFITVPIVASLLMEQNEVQEQ